MSQVRSISGPSAGRPPRTLFAVVQALKAHPRLRGRPNETARYIALSDSSFEGLTGGAVVAAIGGLKRKLGVRTADCENLCLADYPRIGVIVLTPEGTRACSSCGADYGHSRESPTGHEQRAFANPLHRVYHTGGLAYPRGEEGMIRQGSVAVAEFGVGAAGRVLRKALAGLAELCKGAGSALTQEETAKLTDLVMAECRRRASYLTRASSDEAKDAVIAALAAQAGRQPGKAAIYLGLVTQASILFYDPTKPRKSRKSRKPAPLDDPEEGSTPDDPSEGQQ